MHKRPVVAKALARALGEKASQRIWRSVVFAGAMLGTASCGGGSGKPVEHPAPTPAPVSNVADPVTPDPATATPAPPDPTAQAANPCAATTPNPCGGADPANPCGTAGADPAANPCAAVVEPEPATQSKRPRGRKSRKTGRGFILS